MKKFLSVLIAAVLILSIGATSAFAASRAAEENYADPGNDGVYDYNGFIDADGDGICDNNPDGGLCPQDGTGRQARSAAGSPNGANFIDADGDGICDNNPDGGLCPQDGTGRQAGRGFGKNK